MNAPAAFVLCGVAALLVVAVVMTPSASLGNLRSLGGSRDLSSHSPDDHTYTFMRFSRYFDTCDSDDVAIAKATSRVVFATGDHAPSDASNPDVS